MTLREFLDAAYAITVQEAVRLGVPLVDALERTASMAARSMHAEPRARVEPVEAANAQSLKALERMMGGVRRG